MPKRRARKYFGYLLLVPSLIYLGILLFYPLAQSIYWSFHSMHLIRPRTAHDFVGLAHYQDIFHSPDFWYSVLNTVEYTVFGVAGAFLLGLMFALLLNRNFRGRTIARAMIISPWPVPYIVASMVWMWILGRDFGVANRFLLEAGLIKGSVYWLQKPGPAMFSVIAATVWKEFPFAVIMILAALQGIPQEQYDQATTDGANSFQIFRYITLPNLRSVTSIVLLLLIVWIFKRFTIIYVMTGGGPGGATETLIIKTYLTAFDYLKFGRASAMGTIMLCITLAFAAIYLWIQEKRRI